MTGTENALILTELTTDPRGYGFLALISPTEGGSSTTGTNDTEIARRLNLVRDGVTLPLPTIPTGDGGTADGKIKIKRPDCTPAEILEAMDIRDLVLAPAGVASIPLTQSWFESITQFARIRLTNVDGTKTVVRKNLDRITGNTQFSQDRLDAVAIRNGSRAEEKLGVDRIVSVVEVGLVFGRG